MLALTKQKYQRTSNLSNWYIVERILNAKCYANIYPFYQDYRSSSVTGIHSACLREEIERSGRRCYGGGSLVAGLERPIDRAQPRYHVSDTYTIKLSRLIEIISSGTIFEELAFRWKVTEHRIGCYKRLISNSRFFGASFFSAVFLTV